MVKVLILGSTGYLGKEIAVELARAGYQVYGLSRSEEKAKILTKDEIIPVLGDVKDVNKWSTIAEKVDVVIDTTVNYENGTVHAEHIIATIETISKRRAVNNQKKLTYIYTSGLWIHGDNGSEIVTENTPLNNVPPFISWRVPIEQKVISSSDFNGIVIRPGEIYGKSGSLTGLWFGGALAGILSHPGVPNLRWSLVHVDDIADAYLRVVKNADLVKGHIFNITNNQSESVSDCLEAVARVTGYKENPQNVISFTSPNPNNPMEEGLATQTITSNKKAQTLLGWNQRHLGFVDGIDTWWAAWKAHNLK
ncbi:hypothetical protein G9A89_009860 [Geosiphon pyriformis]|nr:hypothetical protein G9A89_009860 [Geosiphon pyriformis]